MKKHILWLLSFILLTNVSQVIADGPGWTAISTVTKIVVTDSGGINVRLSPDMIGCVSQSGYGDRYASVYPGHAGIKKIHANLLTAYMSGKPVQLYLSDNTCRVAEMVLGGL